MENKKTVLIVEDDVSLKNALSLKLETDGFFVIKAKNGKEGLYLTQTKHPDIILLDLKMPVMGGIEMFNVLRDEPWGKNVPVIILTNLSDSKNEVKDDNNSNFDFFVKTNIKLEEIVSKIKEKLGMS